MNNSGLKIYFPNFHGLRAIAALLVLLCHIELVKEWKGFLNMKEKELVVKTSLPG